MLLVELAFRRSMSGTMRAVAVGHAAVAASPVVTAAAIGAALSLVIVQGREAARERARDTWITQTGIPMPRAPLGAAEEVLARKRARAVSAQWLETHAQLKQEAAATDAAPVARVTGYREAAAATEWAADRTATTETTAAWNDEQRRLAERAEDEGHVLVYTWEAEGDRRTCGTCDAKDGQETTDADGFGGWPPLHANCRCQISTSAEPLH